MLQYELPLRGSREDASILPDGTPSGTRTLDTLIKSQVLYQLSYSPVFIWWTVRDSNPGPTGYEPAALPTELTVHNPDSAIAATCLVAAMPFMAPPVGFEPTTLRLTAACSTC